MRAGRLCSFGVGVALMVLGGSACSGATNQDEVRSALVIQSVNPVPGFPEEAEFALATAIARAPAPVLMPTIFATHADQLIWANYGPDIEEPQSLANRFEAMFESREKVAVDGIDANSSFLLQQLNHQVVSPAGHQVADNVSGFILYEQVTTRAPSGRAIRALYTAFRGETTMVMTFTGEQPTIDGLARMLSSLEVASP